MAWLSIPRHILFVVSSVPPGIRQLIVHPDDGAATEISNQTDFPENVTL
jgi:hypothetical protein